MKSKVGDKLEMKEMYNFSWWELDRMDNMEQM